MKTAIILAGGRGERLRPLTQDRPKCMVEVCGRTILDYQLDWLSAYGIKRVIVCCGYLHERIQEHFGDGASREIHIEYSVERQPLGRGGALKRALAHCQDEDFVVALNGDNISNLDLSRAAAVHRLRSPMATVATVSLRSPYGIVDFDEQDDILSFREKPILPHRINAGIYLLNTEIYGYLPDVGDHETETFPELAAERQLKAFHFDGFWHTVDTIKDLTELHDLLLRQPQQLVRAV